MAAPFYERKKIWVSVVVTMKSNEVTEELSHSYQ